MAAAEEMVCTPAEGKEAVNIQGAFADELKALFDRDEYMWRGVYDDTRFDRYVRSIITNGEDDQGKRGFWDLARYQ